MKRTLYIILGTAILAIGIGAGWFVSGYFQKAESVAQTKTMISPEDFKSYQDEQNRQITEQVAQEIRPKLLQARRANDRLTKRLQKLQDSVEALSATIVENTTQGTVHTERITEIKYKDSCNTYKSNYSDKWLNAQVQMNCEEMELGYEVRNEYDIWMEENKHLLKPNKRVIHIRNHNPNTRTNRTINWKVPPPSRKQKWIFGATGMVLGSAITIFVNTQR